MYFIQNIRISLLLEAGVYNLIRGSLFFHSPVSVAAMIHDEKNMNLPNCKLLHWYPCCSLQKEIQDEYVARLT